MLRRFSLSLSCVLLTSGVAFAQEAGAEASLFNGADTAWMLMATALVLLMTPALAFFYGGLVRSKNALNTLMMSFASLGVVAIGWVVLGYSIAFGEGTPFIGDLSHLFLSGIGLDATSGTIPDLLFVAFQGTFVIITAALISGAVVERMRFPAYLLFILFWSLLVYAPVCHWVWGGGWIEGIGAIDFAGGTVVHINAAAAAVVAALFLRPRKDYGRQALLPHNVPFVLLGSGLLWFGWFGFNGGSALAADGLAALALFNTMLAPAATLVVWMLLDHLRTGKVTAVGAATAIVVGLVAVTPAAGFVSPFSAVLLGGIAAVPSYYILVWRARTRIDDSLDVFAAHGMGGITGALLAGVFAQAVWNGDVNGLLFGNAALVGAQALSILATIAYSAALTYGILKGLSFFMAVRADEHEEGVGLDILMHGEEAYANSEGAVLLLDGEMTRGPAVKEPKRAASPAAQPSIA